MSIISRIFKRRKSAFKEDPKKRELHDEIMDVIQVFNYCLTQWRSGDSSNIDLMVKMAFKIFLISSKMKYLESRGRFGW